MLSDASTSDDGLVEVNFTVAYLDIELTIGIRADPGLVVNRCTLRSEVRKWNQSAVFTAHTLRPVSRIQINRSKQIYVVRCPCASNPRNAEI